MTDPTTLDAAREAVALGEKATPGPWIRGNGDFCGTVFQGRPAVAIAWFGDPYKADPRPDADFMVHAGTHYAAITAALLEAEDEIQRLRGLDGDVRVLVARDLLPSLAVWSEPLQVRMEGDVLVFRRPATNSTAPGGW
jgi:hypothetical protein